MGKLRLTVLGMSIAKQERQMLHQPEVVVATPGRLWEVIEKVRAVYTVTLSLDPFSLGNRVAKRSKLIPVTVYSMQVFCLILICISYIFFGL